MRQTTVTIQRPQGTVLATHILVQVDQVSIREAYDLATVIGRRAVDFFKVYTVGWYGNSLLQRDDRLIDELGTDPETGNPYTYVVIGRVKNFEFDHQEAYTEVVVGG